MSTFGNAGKATGASEFFSEALLALNSAIEMRITFTIAFAAFASTGLSRESFKGSSEYTDNLLFHADDIFGTQDTIVEVPTWTPINKEIPTWTPINKELPTWTPINKEVPTWTPINKEVPTWTPVNKEVPTWTPINKEIPTWTPINSIEIAV
jgi:hypothetical protein